MNIKCFATKWTLQCFVNCCFLMSRIHFWISDKNVIFCNQFHTVCVCRAIKSETGFIRFMCHIFCCNCEAGAEKKSSARWHQTKWLSYLIWPCSQGHAVCTVGALKHWEIHDVRTKAVNMDSWSFTATLREPVSPILCLGVSTSHDTCQKLSGTTESQQRK